MEQKPDIEEEKPESGGKKPDIEEEKPDIGVKKPDIEKEKPDIGANNILTRKKERVKTVDNPLKEYLKTKEPDKQEKSYAWHTAIGLQDVDGLKPSPYLYETAVEHIEGKITVEEARERLKSYYREHPDIGSRTAEADNVALRIAQVLSDNAFSFSVAEYLSVHKRLFADVYSHAGKIRTYNITKEEWVLDGATVIYGTASELLATLEYDIAQEKKFNYRNLERAELLRHFASFTAGLWQIHPFEEGNTRTTAVFLIKYLRTLGFDVTNDIFAENARYFRDALVRANYKNLAKGVYATTEYLEMFFDNLLFKGNHNLKSRSLHIIAEAEKPAPDLESRISACGFTAKTEGYVRALANRFGKEAYFGRKEVAEVTGLKASAASDLLKKMLQGGIIETVHGHGKGKYRFY